MQDTFDPNTATLAETAPVTPSKPVPQVSKEDAVKLGFLLDRKEVVFHNRQRLGDMLMFTCGVRDFKKAFPDVRVNVVSVAAHVWDHNPNIDRTLLPTEQNLIKIGPGKLTNNSNWLDWHFANAFRVSMEQHLDVHIPQGESRPDIWFSEEEYNAPRIIQQPYWLITIGGEKGWGCKMYPFHLWQKVVDMNPELTFVQVGAAGDKHPRLQGENVIDHVGKTEDRNTGVRDIFKLMLNAEGSLSLVSFLMHLSGALHKPGIVIGGGREPVSFTHYAGHQYLSTDGCLPCTVKKQRVYEERDGKKVVIQHMVDGKMRAKEEFSGKVKGCWHCNIDTCEKLENVDGEKVPKCVDEGLISPHDISRALRRYYIGGRLVVGIPSPKPVLDNVIKGAKPVVFASPYPVSDIDVEKKYGMKWGGGSLTDRDWAFIEKAIKDYKVLSVLEFGAGLSTLLFKKAVQYLVTYETADGWIKKITEKEPSLLMHKWDGVSPEVPAPDSDLAFVDGPAGGQSREFSTKIAAERADVVVIHDAGREPERKWQTKYLAGKFKGPIKGGHRCHMWVRKTAEDLAKDNPPPKLMVEKKSKLVRIVSTARGWGGCARSVTTIMALLLKAGHKVEFVPFRNSITSSEFKDMMQWTLTDVDVKLDYNAIREPCDTLMVYADDFVWEFIKPEIAEVFQGIKASKKIMMLNYKRGSVGKEPWTRDWDLYAFLNSTQEKEVLKLHPEAKTLVIPPCTDLSPFLAKKQFAGNELRIVRHSSQGDVKFPKDVELRIDQVLKRDNASISMIPGPSFVPNKPGFSKLHKTADPQSIAEFLSTGNCFWYDLPDKYTDMGPRVILEAMAVGLPILADPWGGAIDRVPSDCGWLVSKEEQVKILQNVTIEELKRKGDRAKQFARENFVPQRWVDILTG